MIDKTAFKDVTPLQALKELREAISLYGGHGNPGCPDRAKAYLAIEQADAVLERETKPAAAPAKTNDDDKWVTVPVGARLERGDQYRQDDGTWIGERITVGQRVLPSAAGRYERHVDMLRIAPFTLD